MIDIISVRLKSCILTLCSAAAVVVATLMPAAGQDYITLQSTTSTENSGLFGYILPKFTRRSGIRVRVVAVGTGQAIKNARNGDGDVLLVHAKQAEEKFVADGWGIARHDLMYNDFIIVGPNGDPAGISDAASATEALNRIAKTEAAFVSRGDDSGTHKAEQRLWKDAGIDAHAASGTWYREAGSGMGATLNTGVGLRGYVLTDRATWVSFQNKSGHKILFEGDPALFNQYGIIRVNPQRHSNVKSSLGKRFVDWMLSEDGQAAIAMFRVAGKQLFHPNAKRPE